MSHYTGGTIEIVYPHHNPNEGRDIWNRNFQYVEEAIHFSITGSTSAHTQVDGSSNITVLNSGATVPAIYTVYLNDDIVLNSISASTLSGGTILSGGTNLYDIFGAGGTSGDLWSASTGVKSIIANNGTGNLASGSYSIIGGRANIGTSTYSTVVNGYRNHALGYDSFIGSGRYNSATTYYSTIVGGYKNLVSGNNSFIGNGSYNLASGDDSSILGGYQNLANGYASTVLGGRSNSATSTYSTSSGYNNLASGPRSFIGGGQFNKATNAYSSIIGGQSNRSYGYGTFVGGGVSNLALGNRSFVGNGRQNSATTLYSVVVGGSYNISSGSRSFIGAGATNKSSAGNTFIGSGYKNSATTIYSVVVGGRQNLASGNKSFIGGGYLNSSTSTYSSIVGGYLNLSSGIGSFVGGIRNSATTFSSSISGGRQNLASGNYSSVAAGQNNLSSAESSFIGGGEENITSNTNSSVIGGSGNTVSGTRSVILGGQSIIGSANDTAYVPNLNINTIPANNNALTQILARDLDGTIKYRDAASIMSGATSASTLSQVLTNGNTMLDSQSIFSEDGFGELKMGFNYNGGFESYLYRAQNLTGSSRVGLYTDQKGLVLWDDADGVNEGARLVSNSSLLLRNGSGFSTISDGDLKIVNYGTGATIISSGDTLGLAIENGNITMFSSGYDKGFYLGEGESEWWNQDANEDNQQMKITLGSQEILWGHNNANFDRTHIQNVAYAALALNASNPTFLSGVSNSVIIGGDGITASTDNTVYVPRLVATRTDEAALNLPVLDVSFTSTTQGDVWITTGATSTFINVYVGGVVKSVELS